jgi:hypothetical protein
MNPLGLKPERFTVAERQNEGIIGFGQLELKKVAGRVAASDGVKT